MEKKINKSVFVIPAVYIVLGLVMVIFPETTEKTFCLSLGAIAAVLGIISLVTYFSRDFEDSVYRYDFVNGVMLILLGLLFIVKMEMIIKLIPIMLGVMILANGIMKLQHAIDLKRIEFSGWLYVLVFSLLCLSVGAVCLFRPAFIASTIIILMGISFLFCGITDFITLFLMIRKVKEYAKESSANKGRAKAKKDKDKEKDTITENKKFDFMSALKDKEKQSDTDVQTDIKEEQSVSMEDVKEQLSYADDDKVSDEEILTGEISSSDDGLNDGDDKETVSSTEVSEFTLDEGSSDTAGDQEESVYSGWTGDSEDTDSDKDDSSEYMSEGAPSDSDPADTEGDEAGRDPFGERNETV